MSLINNYQYISNNNNNSINNNNSNLNTACNENNVASLCNNAIQIMDLIIKEINSSNVKSEINNTLANTIKTLLVSFSCNINQNENNNNNNNINNNNINNNNYTVYTPPPAPMLKGISCEIPLSIDFMSPLDLNSPPTSLYQPMQNSTSSTPSSSSPSSPTSSSTPFPPIFNLSQDNFNQQLMMKPIDLNNNSNNCNQFELSSSPSSSPQSFKPSHHLPIVNIPPPFYLDDINDKLNSIEWQKSKITDFMFYGSLGSGSFGTAKLCRHRDTGIFFCSKTLRRNNIVHEKHKEHVQNEINIMLSTNHPFLVKTFTTFQTPSKIHFIMEYASKKDLFYHLRANKQFDESTTKLIVSELVLAIDYLHRENIIYRDLKPENILVDDKGHVKLTDFGFSKKTIYNTTSVCGTLPYMAPEILVSNTGHGKAVDWWALGVVIYELITGNTPFENAKEFLLNRKLEVPNIHFPDGLFSNELKDLIIQLLYIDPLKRLGTSRGGSGQSTIKNHKWFSSIDWNELESKLNNGPLYNLESFNTCELNLNLLNKSKSYNENQELCNDNQNQQQQQQQQQLHQTQSFTFNNNNNNNNHQYLNNHPQQQFLHPQQFYIHNQQNYNLYQSTPQPNNFNHFFNNQNFNFQQQNYKLNNPYIIRQQNNQQQNQNQQQIQFFNNQPFQFNSGCCAKISSGTSF